MNKEYVIEAGIKAAEHYRRGQKTAQPSARWRFYQRSVTKCRQHQCVLPFMYLERHSIKLSIQIALNSKKTEGQICNQPCSSFFCDCEWLVSKWDSEQGQNKLGCHHGQPRCLPELGEIAPEVGLEASEKEAGQGNISYRNKPKIEEELWTLYFSWQASMCADSFSVFSVPFLPRGGIETNKMFGPNISTFQLYLLHLQQAWIFTKVFGALTSFYLS